jgi:hypothetical protein
MWAEASVNVPAPSFVHSARGAPARTEPRVEIAVPVDVAGGDVRGHHRKLRPLRARVDELAAAVVQEQAIEGRAVAAAALVLVVAEQQIRIAVAVDVGELCRRDPTRGRQRDRSAR